MPSPIATDIAQHVVKSLRLPDEEVEAVARVVEGRMQHHLEHCIAACKRPSGRGQHHQQKDANRE